MNTFKIGGVHPEPNKLTADRKIETLALPKQAVFPLSQHIGAPAVPCVQKGDTVRVGTRIAEPGGFMSASIHSSVSGKVAKIDTIVDASGLRKPAIFIDVEGDEWETSFDRSEKLVLQSTKSREEIIECIKNAGSTDPADVLAAIPDTTYEGVTGQITFGENGDADRGDAFIKKVNNDVNEWQFITTQSVG